MHVKAKVIRFYASFPAGAKRSSFINVGSTSPIHLIEYGGLDTIASNGFHPPCCGFNNVSPRLIEKSL